MALFPANGGPNSAFQQSLTKDPDRRFRGPFVGQAFNLVVGNQVYLGVKSSGVLGQESGLFRGIVDSSEKNVFEKDLLMFCPHEGVTGLEKTSQRIALIDRHNFISISSLAACRERAKRNWSG